MFADILCSEEVARLYAPASIVGYMLKFESALAAAQAAEGFFDPALAGQIDRACDPGLYDAQEILAASRDAGSAAIPLVARLTRQVAARSEAAAAWVHHGTTSQDVIDTAMAMAGRAALEAIDRDLSILIRSLLKHAATNAHTPVLARTLLQPASLTTFGTKVVAWCAPLIRSQRLLRTAGRRALQLQLGGPVGGFAVADPRNEGVIERVAATLGLGVPVGSWHTQRDEPARLACELGVLCGSLAKLSRDWSLMSQAEVAELREPTWQGRGGSTAMAHKRNPVAAMTGLAAGMRAPLRVAGVLAAMAQEHERALGGWQSELAEWAELAGIVHGSVHALARAASGLDIDPARMRHNIEQQAGLASAEAATAWLAQRVGRPAAMGMMAGLCKEQASGPVHLKDRLRAELRTNPRLAGFADADLERVFDPALTTLALARQALLDVESWRSSADQLADDRPHHCGERRGDCDL